MSKPRIKRDFDINKNHLSPEGHYVPPRTRDPEEMFRRIGRLPGVLLAEQETAGLKMVSYILRSPLDPDGVYFARRTLSAALFNTAWYDAARDALDVQRRRAKLADLTYETRGPGLDLGSMLDQTALRTERAAIAAARYAKRLARGHDRLESAQVRLGREIGTVSLNLAAAGLATIAPLMTDDGIQEMSRFAALTTQHDSRHMITEIGAHPSVAQLPDPDSPLSVYWRREAPDTAFAALQTAYELHGSLAVAA